MLRNVRKGSLAAVERSAARLGIVRSALEPDVESTDRRLAQVGQNRTHALQRKSAKLSAIASAGGSKRSSESGSISFVITTPPIIDGGWFQALANRVRKSSIRKRITSYSMEELVFEREAAAEYDRAFSHVTRYFMPFVLRAARVAPGMRVLDIAAGTGLSAEAALSAVGPTGHPSAGAFELRAREETRESRGMPCLFLNTERVLGGKPPKKSGFRRHLAGSKCRKRRFSRRSPVGEWSRGARSM